jgi:hypothetical protein
MTEVLETLGARRERLKRAVPINPADAPRSTQTTP